MTGYPRCDRHPRAPRQGRSRRCANQALHIYIGLSMALCEACAEAVREGIRRGGLDPTELVIALAVFTGVLHDGTVYHRGQIVTLGRGIQ